MVDDHGIRRVVHGATDLPARNDLGGPADASADFGVRFRNLRSIASMGGCHDNPSDQLVSRSVAAEVVDGFAVAPGKRARWGTIGRVVDCDVVIVGVGRWDRRPRGGWRGRVYTWSC